MQLDLVSMTIFIMLLDIAATTDHFGGSAVQRDVKNAVLIASHTAVAAPAAFTYLLSVLRRNCVTSLSLAIRMSTRTLSARNGVFKRVANHQ